MSAAAELPERRRRRRRLVRELEARRDDAVIARALAVDERSLPVSVDEEVPRVQCELRPYQLAGFRWASALHARGLGGILADEMGLGKTLQAICLLSSLQRPRLRRPSLVLVPLSVRENWENELAKFAPHIGVFSYVGDKEARAAKRAEIEEFARRQQAGMSAATTAGTSGGSAGVLGRADFQPMFSVVLTTFEVCLRDASFLARLKFGVLVVDEAHRLKNADSELYRTLCAPDFLAAGAQSGHFPTTRLLLTGTPVQNDLGELYALLSFANPSVFLPGEQHREAFIAEFEGVLLEAPSAPEAAPPTAAKSKEQAHRLRRLVDPFLLRRTKEQVVRDLPAKTERILYCPMTTLQCGLYKSLLKKDLSLFAEATALAANGDVSGVAENGREHRQLSNLLVQLRKCTNHPYLFDGVEPEPFELGSHLVEASGKLLLLDRILAHLAAHGHRVLLFSQMTRMLDILQVSGFTKSDGTGTRV